GLLAALPPSFVEGLPSTTTLMVRVVYSDTEALESDVENLTLSINWLEAERLHGGILVEAVPLRGIPGLPAWAANSTLEAEYSHNGILEWARLTLPNGSTPAGVELEEAPQNCGAAATGGGEARVIGAVVTAASSGALAAAGLRELFWASPRRGPP
ncbi:MAG: hypothetical protein LRS49_01180, partial [Desulfurococcales archaeon]|nr:hypothetical protein [Desulfurococcales archaeon]